LPAACVPLRESRRVAASQVPAGAGARGRPDLQGCRRRRIRPAGARNNL